MKRSPHSSPLNATERRAAGALSLVYAVRMLGLFLILPVFALYAERFSEATPFLVGLAIGIYGLTQALFQIPLGALSDRAGRKPVIVGGLVVFAVGSIIAAEATSMYAIILGRTLQGAGAIAGTVMALAADLTREHQRTKVMAAIGISIGLSFVLALILGPILNAWVSVPGIFRITAGLSVLAIMLVLFFVPSASNNVHSAELTSSSAASVLKDRQLLLSYFGVFVLHFILTANFIEVPKILRDEIGISTEQHWQIYLPVMLLSICFLIPFIILAERKGKLKSVFIFSIVLLSGVQLFYGMEHYTLVKVFILLVLFFSAFNYLEAALPSLVSKQSDPSKKGTSLGLFSTAQFLGAFCGGAIGGAVMSNAGASVLFIMCSGVLVLWIIAAFAMKPPKSLDNYVLNIGSTNLKNAEAISGKLRNIKGVREAVVVPEEGIAYLKVDCNLFNEADVREFSASSA